jgi:hypothetical protein
MVLPGAHAHTSTALWVIWVFTPPLYDKAGVICDVASRIRDQYPLYSNSLLESVVTLQYNGQD